MPRLSSLSPTLRKVATPLSSSGKHQARRITDNSTQLSTNFKFNPPNLRRLPIHNNLESISSKDVNYLSLYDGFLDQSQLRSPFEIVPQTDRFYIDNIKNAILEKSHFSKAKDPRLSDLVSYISYKRADLAWKEFHSLESYGRDHLQNLTRIQWFMLLNLVTESPFGDDKTLMKSHVILNTMLEHNVVPTAEEFASIIRVMIKQKKIDMIKPFWNEFIVQLDIPKSVNLWNLYIQGTCNADVSLWSRDFRKSNVFRGKDEPTPVNSAQDLVAQMLAEGIKPNCRTFELTLLSLSQENNFEFVESLISTLWGITPNPDDMPTPLVKKDDPTHPTIMSLIAIINAYGASNQFLKGLKLMEKMKSVYNIEVIKDKRALQLWAAAMKWAYYSSEPWGSTPPIALELMWKSIIVDSKLSPNGSIIWYKLMRDISRRDYKDAGDLIPMFLSSPLVKHSRRRAQTAFVAIAKGYLQTGQVAECEAFVKKWIDLEPEFSSSLKTIEKAASNNNFVGSSPARILNLNQLGRTEQDILLMEAEEENNNKKFEGFEEDIDLDESNTSLQDLDQGSAHFERQATQLN